ncbi:MAG: IgGFc-binding protein [Myxococcota bacterium]
MTCRVWLLIPLCALWVGCLECLDSSQCPSTQACVSGLCQDDPAALPDDERPRPVLGGSSSGGASSSGGSGSSGGPVCTPNTAVCAGQVSGVCDANGVLTEEDCDPLLGLGCDPSLGRCVGACSAGSLDADYFGCDYWPTVTPNAVYRRFSYAVAVANTESVPTSVTISHAGVVLASFIVNANSIEVTTLPWVDELKGGDFDELVVPPLPGASRVVVDSAYRLRSTLPVTVYQFSPLEYRLDNVANCPGDPPCRSFSNDASLLLPSHVLGTSYTVMSWPSQGVGGFISVTATQDNTTVSVTGAGSDTAAEGGGIRGDGSGTAVLNEGDVLQVFSSQDLLDADLSGTRIQASRPVMVVGGHICANVPDLTVAYCDHLEETHAPSDTLGREYVVTVPATPGGVTANHMLRLSAAQGFSTVTFDPPVATSATLQPGEKPLDVLAVSQDVHITGTAPLLVAHFMQGSTITPGARGDPSMALAVPTEQFRSRYIFIASSTYDESYVNIIAPLAAVVRLDNAPVPETAFQRVSGSSWRVARVPLPRTPEFHEVRASLPVGIVVYGYGVDTSYMYAGGTNLQTISP